MFSGTPVVLTSDLLLQGGCLQAGFPFSSAAGFRNSTSGSPTSWEWGGDLEHPLCLFSGVLEMTQPPGPIPVPWLSPSCCCLSFLLGKESTLAWPAGKGPPQCSKP